MRRVAITGIGVISPIGTGREEFFDSLREGRSGIAPIQRFDCSSFDVKLAGEVKRLPLLNEDTSDMINKDPKVVYGFHAAAEALADAAVFLSGESSLLHIGASLEIFNLELLKNCGIKASSDILRYLATNPDMRMPLDTASRLICRHFGKPGGSLVNCSACAVGVQTVGHAFHAVRDGNYDMALCGGFDSMINPLGVGGFQLLGALTADNERGASACRPFDASRSGLVLGEGAALLVLEPLEKARAEGRRIYAEICGYGSTLDAVSLSAPDPNGTGAARAMRNAMDEAGIMPASVGHINTHGTGTVLNDETEATAIREVFAGCWESIPIAAIKCMTGHLIAAAGSLEIAASVFALNEKLIPANINLRKVGAGCELNHVTETGFRHECEYVLTNSFGFGGQNASMVLRKYSV